jgi:hypothetical protein
MTALIVARREVGVEADAELDERRQAPGHMDRARVNPVDAGDALEQRALARAVATDDAEELALEHLEVDPVENVELVEAVASKRVDRALLERVHTIFGQAEALVQLMHPDRDLARRHGVRIRAVGAAADS